MEDSVENFSNSSTFVKILNIRTSKKHSAKKKKAPRTIFINFQVLGDPTIHEASRYVAKNAGPEEESEIRLNFIDEICNFPERFTKQIGVGVLVRDIEKSLKGKKKTRMRIIKYS